MDTFFLGFFIFNSLIDQIGTFVLIDSFLPSRTLFASLRPRSPCFARVLLYRRSIFSSSRPPRCPTLKCCRFTWHNIAPSRCSYRYQALPTVKRRSESRLLFSSRSPTSLLLTSLNLMFSIRDWTFSFDLVAVFLDLLVE